MSLNALAIAVQGIGFTPLLMAAQGFGEASTAVDSPSVPAGGTFHRPWHTWASIAPEDWPYSAVIELSGVGGIPSAEAFGTPRVVLMAPPPRRRSRRAREEEALLFLHRFH